MNKRTSLCVLAVVCVLCLAAGAAAQPFAWVPTSGPLGGGVWNLARDSAGRIFASVPYAGVFRSLDNGATWQEINTSLWNTGVQDVLVLPDDRLLLAVGSCFYRSTDHGDTWQMVNNDTIGQSTHFALAADGTVLAAGLGVGIYRSTTEGSTWTRTLADNAYVFGIAVSPTTGHAFAVSGGYPPFGVWRSTDHGQSWAPLATFPANGTVGVRAVTVLPSGRIIVSGEGCTAENPGWGNVYYSDDDGANWIVSPTTITRCHAQMFARDDAGTLWAPVYQDGGLAKSTDDGATWSEVGLAPRDLLTVLPLPGGTLLIGSSSKGVLRATTANPATAVETSTGLRGSYTLDVEPVGAGRIVASAAYGVAQSDDGGATWRTVASHPLGYESQSTSYLVTRAPGGALVADLNGFMARSWDNGDTWSITPHYDPNVGWVGNWLAASADATDSGGRLFLANRFDARVWVSADNAVSFALTSAAPMPWGSTELSAMTTGTDGVLYVGTADGRLFRSADAGQTFEPMTAGSGWLRVGALVTAGARLYAGVSGSGVWASDDDGATWTQLYATTSEVFRLVRNVEGTLFLAQSGGVVSTSEDGGATWVDVAGFDRPGLNPLGLALDDEGYLLAATGGGGVYRTAATTLHEDTTPPVVATSVDRDDLWPPNGKLVSVVVRGNATDGGPGTVSGVAGQIGSFRVVDEYGEVQPSGSFVVGTDGRFSVAVPLRAARRGQDRDGRSYAIVVCVSDRAGNPGSATVVVTVPHDQRRP